MHQAYRSCVKRKTRTPLQTLLASTTEATCQRCWSLEEPGARVMRGYRAPLAGCLPTGRLKDGTLHSTVSRTAKLLSDRLGDGHDCSPASCNARAVSKTHCAFLTRYALTARTKQFGLTLALPSQNFALMLASFNAASSRACLRRPRWATRDASSLHNVRTINYAVAD